MELLKKKYLIYYLKTISFLEFLYQFDGIIELYKFYQNYIYIIDEIQLYIYYKIYLLRLIMNYFKIIFIFT